MFYSGRCHCGSIVAAFETATVPRLRQDGCSFCASRSVKSASDPDGSLHLRAAGPVTRYRFGHRTADFLLCGVCGTYVATMMGGPKGPVGVMNVVGLSVPELKDAQADFSSLDGESPEERLRRRLSRWTPMRLEEAGA